MPYYLYVAAVDLNKHDRLRSEATRTPEPGDRPGPRVPVEGQDRMDASGSIYQALKKATTKMPGRWEDVQFPTPEGGQVAWQKLRAVGPQEFVFYARGVDRPKKKLDGVLELYAHVEGDWLVLIGWRSWKEHEKNIGLDQVIPLMAGSVKM
jgi:hypothetical protein